MTNIDFDNTQALDEGWGIFDCFGSDNGDWQIQKVDEWDAFASDDDVWRYVLQQASYGCAYYSAALDFIRVHSPVEWQSIQGFIKGTA